METHASAETQAVLIVQRSRVRPCKNQPRTYFNREALQSLAESISAKGQKTPAEVKPLDDDPDHDYELTDGERRWRALDMLGIPTIRVWVNRVANPEEQFLNSVMANFGREGHTPMETARAIKRILEMPDYTEGSMTDRLVRVAKLFAKSGSWANLHLNLLDLHADIQAMLEPDAPEGRKLGVAFASFLHGLDNKNLQLMIARKAAKDGLTLSQARRLARKMAEAAGTSIGSQRAPSDVKKTFQRFLEQLADGADSIMELPQKPFQEMIQKAEVSYRREIITKIDKGIERLKELRQAVERAPK